MIIDCISDLHGYYPKLDGGDLLIVAGDLTSRDDEKGFQQFRAFILNHMPKYKKIIVICGNHDEYSSKRMEEERSECWNGKSVTYLCDSGTEFEGLKIWGSPWTLTFDGMNPHCKAFTVRTEEELGEKWALIPDDVDILITHSPCFSYLDNYLGSPSLRLRTREIILKSGGHKGIRLHVCGHIHEGYGEDGDIVIPIRVNASLVNEHYEPVNKPIRVIL
jgi:predicted phosphodiesterase